MKIKHSHHTYTQVRIALVALLLAPSIIYSMEHQISRIKSVNPHEIKHTLEKTHGSLEYSGNANTQSNNYWENDLLRKIITQLLKVNATLGMLQQKVTLDANSPLVDVNTADFKAIYNQLIFCKNMIEKCIQHDNSQAANAHLIVGSSINALLKLHQELQTPLKAKL